MKKKLDILYEDKYLIAVNKKENLLTISDGKNSNNLYSEVSDYLKKQNKNNKVFIIHRLDRDTSGIVIFAKSEKIKKKMQDNWENVRREYIGIVNGCLRENKGIIKKYLKETKTLYVYSTDNENKGKLAITEYETIESNKKYTKVLIKIKTGRKHQIRVSFNDLGNPLVGDTKYGNIKGERLYLHAHLLEFTHPITNELITLTSNIPKTFDKLI